MENGSSEAGREMSVQERRNGKTQLSRDPAGVRHGCAPHPWLSRPSTNERKSCYLLNRGRGEGKRLARLHTVRAGARKQVSCSLSSGPCYSHPTVFPACELASISYPFPFKRSLEAFSFLRCRCDYLCSCLNTPTLPPPQFKAQTSALSRPSFLSHPPLQRSHFRHLLACSLLARGCSHPNQTASAPSCIPFLT